MNFIEWIGFLISFFVLFILFGKRSREARQQHNAEGQGKKQAQEALLTIKELLPKHKTLSLHPHQQHGKTRKKTAATEAKTSRPSGEFGASIEKETRRFDEELLKPSIEQETRRFDEQLLKPARESKTNAPSYEVKRQLNPSRGSHLIQQLPSKQMMLVYKELFGRPRSHQQLWDDLP